MDCAEHHRQAIKKEERREEQGREGGREQIVEGKALTGELCIF